MKEKKARVEDALHATRAAVEEGIVPGGGVALLRARGARGLGENERAARGREHHPARARGAAAADRRERGHRRLDRRGQGEEREGRSGFNARTEDYEDLLKAGVIDPTKVVRTAIQNAASVASLLLTTEAMVAEKPEEKGAGGPAGRHARRHGRMM
jgi:chaperonin GroEL